MNFWKGTNVIRRQLNTAWLVVLVAACLTSSNVSAAEEAIAGLLFRPVEPCTLLDTAGGLRLAAEPRALHLEGGAPSSSAESAEEEEEPAHCGASVLGAARAALLRVAVDFATAPGALKLWAGAADDEPKVGVMAVAPPQVGQGLVLVDLCRAGLVLDPGQVCSKKLWSRLDGAEADLRVELVGVFESPSSDVVLAEPPQLEAATSALTAPFWQEDANGIHFSEGKVGVGTDLPEALLQVGSWALDNSRYLVGGDALSLQGIEGQDHLPYLELRDETWRRAFYLGWGSKANRYVNWKFENGYDLAISGGNLGYGVTAPSRNFHWRGSFLLEDPISGHTLFDTQARTTTGYAGGTAHNRTVAILRTPFQSDQLTGDSSWILGSPEVWGGEAIYTYSFGDKNLRLGAANDSWRRVEIEIFNNNSSSGKILFRTGAWRDPDNVPGTSAGVRMVINESGNVGIGSATPSSRLLVTQDAAGSGDASATATIDAASSGAEVYALKLRATTTPGSAVDLFTVRGDGQARLSGALEVPTLKAPVGSALEVTGDLRLSGNLTSVGDLCIGVCQ